MISEIMKQIDTPDEFGRCPSKNSRKNTLSIKLLIWDQRLHLTYTILIFCQFLLFSCTYSPKNKHNDDSVPASQETLRDKAALSPNQQGALDALNTLQRNVKGDHIYSTFPGISHSFSRVDTSFEITSDQFAQSLIQIYQANCYPSDTIMNNYKFFQEASLAQNLYTVHKCRPSTKYPDKLALEDVTDNRLQSGIWVLPNVLNRRDVILIW